jgi:tetratricopeptide (TPR) repeat protein
MADPKKPQQHDAEPVTLHSVIAQQNDLLQKLHATFGTEEEEERQRRLVKLFLRGASLIALAISGLIGSWELGAYLKESWEIDRLAKGYAQVGVELYYEENNANVARKFLGKALELAPDDADYLYMDAYIDGMAAVRDLFNLDRPYTADELNAAHEALAKSVLLENQQPDSAEPYILRGQIYAALKDHERARDVLLKAVRLDPRTDFALMRLGVVEYNAGNKDSATSYMKQALALNPESKWAHLWNGVMASDAGKTNQALAHFGKSLAVDPRFDLAHYNIAWAYLGQKPKAYDKAEAAFRKALALNPNYKQAFYGLGMVFGYQNEYTVAREYLTKALDLDAQFLTALKWRGIVNDELGNLDEALSDFSAAISIDPSQADLYVRRSRALTKGDEFTDALADLQFAKRLDQKNPRIELYLSRIYNELGQFSASMDSVNNALELRAGFADALAHRASLHLANGFPDNAVTDYKSAITSTSYRLDRFYLKIGQIRTTQKALDLAVVALREARAINPANAAAWKAETNALLELGDRRGAAYALEQYVRLSPNDPDIKELQSKL